MHRAILTIFLGLFVLSAPAANASGLALTRSAYSVAETIDRLEAALRAKGLTIFARIDHGANARRIGVDLRPVQLLIFGSPKIGSQLLTSNPMVGLDLPMKALAWEDDDGEVWLAYNRPQYLADRYDIRDRAAVIAKMKGALEKFANAATRR